MFKKRIFVSYAEFSADEIAQRALRLLPEIQDFAWRKGFVYPAQFPPLESLSEVVAGLSLNRKKLLVRVVLGQECRLTFHAANRYLRLLYGKLGGYPAEEVPQLGLSEKELAIRSARQEWLAARDAAEQLRLAYVAEKGDFYER
jgi:hypothetical protein